MPGCCSIKAMLGSEFARPPPSAARGPLMSVCRLLRTSMLEQSSPLLLPLVPLRLTHVGSSARSLAVAMPLPSEQRRIALIGMGTHT